MHLTDEFSEVCYSFTCHGEPISEEIVSRFKELSFDEKVRNHPGERIPLQKPFIFLVLSFLRRSNLTD